jgi:hypothetical protein
VEKKKKEERRGVKRRRRDDTLHLYMTYTSYHRTFNLQIILKITKNKKAFYLLFKPSSSLSLS